MNKQVHGGSWNGAEDLARASTRIRVSTAYRYFSIGFRIKLRIKK